MNRIERLQRDAGLIDRAWAPEDLVTCAKCGRSLRSGDTTVRRASLGGKDQCIAIQQCERSQ